MWVENLIKFRWDTTTTYNYENKFLSKILELFAIWRSFAMWTFWCKNSDLFEFLTTVMQFVPFAFVERICCIWKAFKVIVIGENVQHGW